MATVTNRAQAYREINRLRALLKLAPITDNGSMTLAALQREITRLEFGTKPAAAAVMPAIGPALPTVRDVYVVKPAVTTATPTNKGAVVPAAPVWAPVSGPTASQATAAAVKSTNSSATAKQPSRSSLYSDINRLRGLLKLAPIVDDGKLTIAALQREITKLDYSVKNPAPVKTAAATSATSAAGGDKTKAQLVRDIDKALASLGQAASGLDPNAMNRTQLVGTLSALEQQGAVTSTAGGAGGGAVDAIMGIPRNTFLIAGAVLIGLTVLMVLKKKKGKR
jgi:hypothetical protein